MHPLTPCALPPQWRARARARAPHVAAHPQAEVLDLERRGVAELSKQVTTAFADTGDFNLFVDDDDKATSFTQVTLSATMYHTASASNFSRTTTVLRF